MTTVPATRLPSSRARPRRAPRAAALVQVMTHVGERRRRPVLLGSAAGPTTGPGRWSAGRAARSSAKLRGRDDLVLKHLRGLTDEPGGAGCTICDAQGRVAPQLEEVVVNTDPVMPITLPQIPVKALLDVRGATARRRQSDVRRREAATAQSTLPFRVSGSGVDDDEGGGDHEVGQAVDEVTAQRRREVGSDHRVEWRGLAITEWHLEGYALVPIDEPPRATSSTSMRRAPALAGR